MTNLFEKDILPTCKSEETQKFYVNVVRLDDTDSEMNLGRIMKFMDRYHPRRPNMDELPGNIWVALGLYLGEFIIKRYPGSTWVNQEQFTEDLYDLQFVAINVPVKTPSESVDGNIVKFEVYPFAKIMKYYHMDRVDENLLTWFRAMKLMQANELKTDGPHGEWRSAGKGIMVRDEEAVESKQAHFDKWRSERG